MTVIVYRDGVMAADTGAWVGDVCVTMDEVKVRRSPNGSLVGCAGRVPDVELFHAWVAAGCNVDERPFEREEGGFGAIVVGPDGAITHYDHGCRSYPGRSWAIEGTHEEFMLACLLAGLGARETVALAIRHCSHAAGEVYALDLSVTPII